MPIRVVVCFGIFVLALLCAPTSTDAANREVRDASKSRPPLMLRNPSVSKTHVAFAYADDLWVVSRAGGEARRLTTGQGVETDPVFSPDGETVAFTGQYDGNEDVYIVPTRGGEPKRLTYHPAGDQAVGWTPDGKKILLRSTRNSHSRYVQLFTIGLDGGLPEVLPLPAADHGCFSAEGTHLVYSPRFNFPRRIGAHVAWRQYRGGNHPELWIADLADSSIVKIPNEGSNDLCPMWVGDTIWFLSDRDGPVTLFAYDTKTKKIEKKLENRASEDIRTASFGAGVIVIEKASGLSLFDLENGKTSKLDVAINADLPGVREKFVKVEDNIQRVALSPSGARVLLEARGDVFTVPATKGETRNLSKSSASCERDPAWSPDGKSIAYLSDASGEYELHVAPQDGKGKAKNYKLGDGPSFFYSPTWSPDSKSITYADKKLNLWLLNLDSGKSIKIDTNPYFDMGRLGSGSWSPDSKWIAYSRQLDNYLSAVFLYSVDTKKSVQITDGMSDAMHPVFDKGGQYLYFTASTDVGPSRGSLMSSLNRAASRSVYVVVLNEKTKSPLAPESDEEGESKPAEKVEKKDEGKKTPAAKAEKKGDAKADGNTETKVDLEGIDQRILALPVPARNFVALMPGKTGQVYLLEGAEFMRMNRLPFDNSMPSATLHRFEISKRKPEKILEGIQGATLSDNGEKLLYRQAGRWFLTSSAAIKPGDGALRLDGLEMRVDPRAEWRQIYNEVWRIQRDFIYDPNFHGLDLKKSQEKFAAWLPGIASRHDLNHLLEEMLGDLCLGHVYIGGGDLPSVRGTSGGLLGCDFKVVDGKYQFARIYRGENWNPELRAPLTQPGTRVKEGEFLLAVDGVDLEGKDSVYRLFEGKANKQVTLKVGSKADGSDAREVVIRTLASEQPLRHYDWITTNREKVAKATDGRVAYIYLPNTAAAGRERFDREFYAQINKDAAIIDERYNGGGFLADEVVNRLNVKPESYIATREGKDMTFPRAIFGPKVMIVNESAGSGGDYLPYTFRQAKAGTIVGKRTWGGLVGIGGYPSLLDGGSVTAPHWALYFPSGKWDVENEGVAPDMEVEMDPKAVREGRDPQLESAIKVALAELKKTPMPKVKRPAYPNYHLKDPTKVKE
jgi:tricorn protease